MSTFAIGFREDRIEDLSRRNWSDDGPRPIGWSAWYPARTGSEPSVSNSAGSSFFVTAPLALDAELHESRQQFPVVLLSHGTGGTASSLTWLAERLASHGYIVIGVDHHGNTASEPYKPEGFLCWWERPRDLSMVLNRLSVTGPFTGRLNLDHVSAIGFSLGGSTVLALAGAVTDMDLYSSWAKGTPFEPGPKEFPDLADHITVLRKRSAVFRASWQRQSASTLDTRVKAVVTLAPAPTIHAFTPASLASIFLPTTIMVGGADTAAPADSCAKWLHDHLGASTLISIGADVGHYTLLGEGTDMAKKLEPGTFVDRAGVDRRSVHENVARIARDALSTAFGRVDTID